MIINLNKPTTAAEPYYYVLFIEQKEEVIGCVMNDNFECQECKLKILCRCKKCE